MLTSKEVLEKTGISRATLNNYIGWGIVPRPDVLPPEPQDGAAPRIGYFPPEIIQRIEEIQRLKREGWSITRISEHFGAEPTAPASVDDIAKASRPPAAIPQPVRGAMPGLSIDKIAHPAYMVNDSFDVVWLNDAARPGTWAHFAQLPQEALSHGLFKHLLPRLPADADSRKAILSFHLGLAKQRGTSPSDLFRDLAPQDRPLMERLYAEAERIESGLVARISIPGAGAGAAQAVSLQAVRFREGILFLYSPAGGAPEEVSPAKHERGRVPALTQVAVLVTDLQHSARLWSELPAEEYFELINRIWVIVDPIIRRHRGTHGKHPGEGVVCYFFPQADSSHLWNALLAAHRIREAMRHVSKEWQLRKGWATELYMNTGIDEGQEWLGTFRSGAQVEFTVLGDAVNHAMHISNFSRSGAVWATRNLLGKLSAQERRRLKYGVRRKGGDGQEIFVPSTFSRVENLIDPTAPGNEHLAAIARLSISEILDIAADAGAADHPAGRDPH